MKLAINTDGASRGNPGQASYGFIIKNDSGVILHQEGKAIGKATNNVAEYTGVLKAFEYVDKYLNHKSPHRVDLYTDSQLIARQLKGEYKIKSQNLLRIYSQIKKLEVKLGEIKYKNIPRNENFIADRLANKALDERI